MKKPVLLLGMVALSLTVVGVALATPTLPVILVNDTTKQCVQAIQGDDCHWCEPAEGWRLLGYAGNTQCPAGYADLGSVGMTGNCTTYKTEFCCTSWQHRGDCEDLVINTEQRQCAFVEEITGCALPAGWNTPVGLAMNEALCPTSYQWAPAVACGGPTEPVSPPAITAATGSVTPSPVAAQGARSRGPMLGIGLGFALAAFCIVIGLLLRRQRRKRG